MDEDLIEDLACGCACLQCGDELETWGIFMKIAPTIFCEKCCSDFKHQKDSTAAEYGKHVVTKTQALALYGCSEEDLNDLNYSVFLKRRCTRSVQLYLGAEVFYLGEQRVLKRMNHVERKLHINMKELDSLLKVFGMDGFLNKEKALRCSVNEVEKRFHVFDRATAIRSCFPTAYPGAIFHFCVTYPEGGPAEFADMQHRVQSIFRLEGKRIFTYLSRTELKNLQFTQLKDALLDVFGSSPD